jgi:hypothetical protein
MALFTSTEYYCIKAKLYPLKADDKAVTERRSRSNSDIERCGSELTGFLHRLRFACPYLKYGESASLKSFDLH